MKKTITGGFMTLAVFFVFSCEQRRDSVQEAQDRTEDRLEARGQDRRGGLQDRRSGLIDDSEHIINLASSSMFQVEAGQLAAQRAQNQEVKSFAQKMVEDHRSTQEQLRNLAQNKNISLPQQMGRDHMDRLNDIREEQGADFDEEYMDAMVSSHDEDLDRVENLQESEDQNIRSFAQNALPGYRQHHEQAQQLEDRVNNRVTRADRDTRRRGERDTRGGWRYRTDDAGQAGRGTGTGTRN
jgi:putative membrane protein